MQPGAEKTIQKKVSKKISRQPEEYYFYTENRSGKYAMI